MSKISVETYRSMGMKAQGEVRRFVRPVRWLRSCRPPSRWTSMFQVSAGGVHVLLRAMLDPRQVTGSRASSSCNGREADPSAVSRHDHGGSRHRVTIEATARVPVSG